MSYNKLGKLASILTSKNFGLFGSESLESLFLVETELDDQFIAKTLCNQIS